MTGISNSVAISRVDINIALIIYAFDITNATITVALNEIISPTNEYVIVLRAVTIFCGSPIDITYRNPPMTTIKKLIAAIIPKVYSSRWAIPVPSGFAFGRLISLPRTPVA